MEKDVPGSGRKQFKIGEGIANQLFGSPSQDRRKESLGILDIYLGVLALPYFKRRAERQNEGNLYRAWSVWAGRGDWKLALSRQFLRALSHVLNIWQSLGHKGRRKERVADTTSEKRWGELSLVEILSPAVIFSYRRRNGRTVYRLTTDDVTGIDWHA